MIRLGCTHTEAHKRKDGAVIDQHDCAYVDERNRHVNAAERAAHRAADVSVPGLWNRAFFAAMDEAMPIARVRR